jgi:hypothetical protein
MSLLERIFAEPELLAAPPVLVDVGAAGGVHPAWRWIARYSIGVGFEPDARDAAALAGASDKFRRWILWPGLVLPELPPGGTATLHLTRSPQCSSTLRPRQDKLGDWAFAEFFEVVETRSFPATTLTAVLAAHQLDRIDWLKCDTQGLDLRIFLSLPAAVRRLVLAVEFEPGLIDAYEGEDKLAEVLAAMQAEPFWLAAMKVGRTPRGSPPLLERHLGKAAVRWVRRSGPAAPAWANVRYLRSMAEEPDQLDRRALLLAWVFATITREHGEAMLVAQTGEARFGGPLFAAMLAASVRRLRWAMVRNLPVALWRRLTRA